MKVLTILIFILSLAGSAFAGDVYVKGHWKDTNRDGVKDTYVQPYHRTSPDSNRLNNYSTEGNYNPYTGKPGTVDPYQQNDPQYNYQPSNNNSLYR